jgi:hypothetical protein
MRASKTFVTLPEIGRFALVPTSTLQRQFSRLGVKPDEVVRAGRGNLALFRRDRLPELLASIQSHLSK